MDVSASRYNVVCTKRWVKSTQSRPHNQACELCRNNSAWTRLVDHTHVVTTHSCVVAREIKYGLTSGSAVACLGPGRPLRRHEAAGCSPPPPPPRI
eukprot:scaffold71765_cov75-Phaeocystis_antarctica.AAC.3